MHFTNYSSYHLGRFLINLQYSQKLLCGDVGGRGGEDICKEIRKFNQIMLSKVCLGSKNFKSMKQENDDV
jgi:hypothetical protein